MDGGELPTAFDIRSGSSPAMHILFVHQNYPAQFGHIARCLAERSGVRCSFVSELPPGIDGKVERLQYRIQGGATAQTHFFSRTFENNIWHAHAVYESLKNRPDIRPDLIVGHSGFGSTVLLRELLNAKIINYFEYYYHTRNSDMDFRPDFPCSELSRLRARCRNAMILLDLENCDRGHSPLTWQRDQLPSAYRGKVDVIFDGIDMAVWRCMTDPPRRIGTLTFPEGVKIVSYATRGMESMRGFDIFMRFAKQLGERHPDVQFVVAGQDRVCYGGDESVTGGKSFKNWVLDQDQYDLSRIHFVGLLPPTELARLFNITDLHVYMTVPFVLSWSLFNALACGATVLASDTAPVREVIREGETGLLVEFFDVEGMVERAERVLASPQTYRPLGQAGMELIRGRYSLDVCLPQMLTLYESVLGTSI
jgi:glycosyltransferase involved in cell wall biosynthesis